MLGGFGGGGAELPIGGPHDHMRVCYLLKLETPTCSRGSVRYPITVANTTVAIRRSKSEKQISPRFTCTGFQAKQLNPKLLLGRSHARKLLSGHCRPVFTQRVSQAKMMIKSLLSNVVLVLGVGSEVW